MPVRCCVSVVNYVLLRIKLVICFILIAALDAVTLEGRLPGEFFREDNPPRYGTQMSFVSRRGATVLLHAITVSPEFTVAKQLEKIAHGFRVKAGALKKTALIEGSLRWLQYAFHKKKGGGFVYITRRENLIIYVVLFNLDYDALSGDLPYINRYVKELRVSEPTAAPAD
jgi:hypothetical protein